MASNLLGTRFQSLLASGAVNAGGHIHIYETGTTNNVGAGSALDDRGGSDVSNPLTLDSTGQAKLWLLEGAQYTIKEDDSAGAQIRSTDGIAATDLQVWVASGSNISYQAGKVGIGGAAGSEDLKVTGTVAITDTLAVTGATTLSSTLAVTGAATLSSTLAVGTVTVTGSLNVSGSLSTDSGTTVFDYTESSYTATVTGGTTSPTFTVQYIIIGKKIQLYVPIHLAPVTSNATTFTITGAPAAVRPFADRAVTFGGVTDAGTAENVGKAIMNSAGTIEMERFTGGAWAQTWTNSGTKTAHAFTMIYDLVAVS